MTPRLCVAEYFGACRISLALKNGQPRVDAPLG